MHVEHLSEQSLRTLKMHAGFERTQANPHSSVQNGQNGSSTPYFPLVPKKQREIRVLTSLSTIFFIFVFIPPASAIAIMDPDTDRIMIIVGTIGGFAISLSLVPQVYLTYKTRCADDISYYYQAIYIFGTALVNTYAIYFGLYAVYIPCLLEFSLIVALTIMKVVYPSRKDLTEELKLIASRHSLSNDSLGLSSLDASRRKSLKILKNMSLSEDLKKNPVAEDKYDHDSTDIEEGGVTAGMSS
jgi:MtN3 and saliva related transmembrane protein